jgi:methylated-DNA-[protein]-cysteine S-methyltransferase
MLSIVESRSSMLITKTHCQHHTKNDSHNLLIAFSTEIGWIGITHRRYTITRIKLGYASRRELFEAFREMQIGSKQPDEIENDWIADFRNFCKGRPVYFDRLSINDSQMTAFQRDVVNCCRRIPFGETVSYGELAAQAGYPKAARAVGSVMRKNCYPLVVPCHRVVASKGLGGFSANNGTELKIRLLELEGTADRFRR